MASSSETPTPPPPLLPPSPALSAINVASIKTHLPITLDLKSPNFAKWREFFLVTLGKYALTHHVDGSIPPNPTDPSWQQTDYIVLSWIYNSISTDVFDLVMKPKASAHDMWIAIEQTFHDNKKSRAVQLESEFRNLVQGSLSISDYCQKLKHLADALADIDHTISDETLVLQTIRGLHTDFNTIATLIPMQSPFPTFSQVRSMLLLDESRRSSLIPVATALAASHAPPPNQHHHTRQQPWRGRGGYRGNRPWHGGRGGGRYWHNNQQHHQHPSYYQAPFQQQWVPPPHANQGLLGPAPRNRPPQALLATPATSTAPQWDQNALVGALNDMSLHVPMDTNWYMDSGASAHMTSQTGERSDQILNDIYGGNILKELHRIGESLSMATALSDWATLQIDICKSLAPTAVFVLDPHMLIIFYFPLNSAVKTLVWSKFPNGNASFRCSAADQIAHQYVQNHFLRAGA